MKNYERSARGIVLPCSLNLRAVAKLLSGYEAPGGPWQSGYLNRIRIGDERACFKVDLHGMGIRYIFSFIFAFHEVGTKIYGTTSVGSSLFSQALMNFLEGQK